MPSNANGSSLQADSLQRFDTRNAFSRHRIEVHVRQPLAAEPAPFKCNQCDRQYMRSNSLRKHQRLRHGEGPRLRFVCPVCGKDYLFKNEFVAHELSHSRQRHHVCDICGKRFGSNSTLGQHMRTHEGNVWEWMGEVVCVG